MSNQLNLHQELFDMGNEFALFNDQIGYRQVFHFFFSKADYGAVNRCLNNIEVLEKFCSYFIEVAKPLITTAIADPLVKAWSSEETPYAAPSKLSENDLQKQALLEAFQNRLIPNETQPIDLSKLSGRERDCVYFIQRGFTSKQIAKVLNISFRTVESYIENVREKYDIKTKFDIAKVFMNIAIAPTLSRAFEP